MPANMSQSVVKRLAERVGTEPVGETFTIGEIRQIRFDTEVDYETVAEAAATVDAETSDDVVIWGCGVTSGGQPQVAMQRIKDVDPADVDASSIERGSTPDSSDRAARRQSISMQSNQASTNGN